ncbi:MAG: bifunctional diaminohydroxyphosphoribosylaminopyrimidine deaminase/5-amino-6-(5-phosphoribosylamino)uracil reductase RibD [Gammaproteobacteria bacterium]|nr:bifunctional diaminohydroxyphosphoribosylaminopyrimidine deaminase/5-amino-6-(5-phosphoribosylamino)uracil reductase RibD [Gammaproteobacteria bacterium]
MARALELAARGINTTHPNPRVGCVIVKDGRVVGEGWHERAGESHAEIFALREAGVWAHGATVYVTLEPCSHHGRTPPCTEALTAAEVARVVVAMEDPFPQVAGRGVAQLRAAGIDVEIGLLAEQASALNAGFISRCRRERPFVRCKLAMSLDGHTALASGVSQWISSDAARQDVQRLRASSAAILSSIETVLADDPLLDVRLPEVTRQPVRVIVDSRLRLPSTAKLFSVSGEIWVGCAEADSGRKGALIKAGASIIETGYDHSGRHLDLTRLLQELARREINDLLVEAGPALNGALLAAGLVDEIILYMAPHLLGQTARPLFHLPVIEQMTQRVALEILDVRMVGQDLRLTARPVQ